MEMLRMRYPPTSVFSPALVLALLLGSGCTWVKISDEARAVELVDAGQVTACKRLGTVSSKVKAKVAGITRGANKIRVELDNLARERALEMGANTLVRESIEDGDGRYSAYDCP
jgi:hypothetical protein